MVKLESFLNQLDKDSVVIDFEYAKWIYSEKRKLLDVLEARGETPPGYYEQRGIMSVWKMIMQACCEHDFTPIRNAEEGREFGVNQECEVCRKCGMQDWEENVEDFKTCYNCQNYSYNVKDDAVSGEVCWSEYAPDIEEIEGTWFKQKLSGKEICPYWKGKSIHGKSI